MDAFKEVIEDIDGQFIVWAMYEEEINQVLKALKEAGKRVVTYYGKTSADDREKAIDDFQSGNADVFLGHAQAAGIGLTLTAANLALYYSCSPDNELRKQSEDRCHRIGTKGKSVLYIDLVAEDTIDLDIQRQLAVKTEIAELIIDRKGG
jgi:SNF2 family DNA or RNA helicase